MTAAPVHRLPQPHTRRRWPARIVGVLATSALLGVGALMATMVMPSGDVVEPAVLDAAPAATPEPVAADTQRGKPALTRVQKRQRAEAVALLRDLGYRPVKLAAYDPSHTLRVLIGRGDAGRRAFFFFRGRYLGNDTVTDSAWLRLVRGGERTAIVSYRLFANGDEACCPTGGIVRVRFRWDGKRLSPDDAIPPASSRLARA